MRLKVRHVMVGIALVAIALALVERHSRFKRIAEYHGSQVSIWHGVSPPTTVLRLADSEPLPPTSDDWHFEMKQKCEWAAAHPWLPVRPDPPVPE